MRYNKTIEIKTNRNGEVTIDTDRGQTWKTTVVKEENPFGTWLWAHHTPLRTYQRDFMQIIHKAFNPEHACHAIELYWVYQRGRGYQDQTADIALARIPTCNVWIIMTPDNTWLIENQFSNFTLKVSDALGPVTDQYTKDQLWNFHDSMLGLRSPKKQYTEQDYVEKGIAP
jgi:hypothetical protein